MMSCEKRKIEEEESEEWVGPRPTEAVSEPAKKLKVLPHQQIYLDNLPDCETYERSYLHRDTITHLLVTATDFVITASCDGHLKFWKKVLVGIEFVKHFRCHLEAITDMAANCNGLYLCTGSVDKSVKVFDIINFDMINMFRTGFVPRRTEWIHKASDPVPALAVSDADSSKIYIYDGKGSGEALRVLDRLHCAPITVIRYCPALDLVVSADKKGILEYWATLPRDFCIPSKIRFSSKLDTDLFIHAKLNTYPLDIAFTPDGSKFATVGLDKRIRIFKTLKGKLVLVVDEGVEVEPSLPQMELGRRRAGERDLDVHLCNAVFDHSGHFLFYGTMLGIKVVNIFTKQVVKMFGKAENLRPLHVALFQGSYRRGTAAVTLELEASENPALEAAAPDPTLFTTAHRKNRFYLFSRRAADDTDTDRDVFNEKPSKEDIVAATDSSSHVPAAATAILHTEFGDIHMTLFPKEAPKACHNFTAHARAGYYNGHIFHRVIKGFMIQTGDPTGTGSGGESVWGGEFEDEFDPGARHDKPYTVSMANAGPNSNGSQFFITVAPTPWLDNKHTVFGRVHRGMEVVLNISNAKVNPKTSKPHDDIRIVSISLK